MATAIADTTAITKNILLSVNIPLIFSPPESSIILPPLKKIPYS
jgi:hypothetical protein